jgi:hypothetical protein
LTAPSLDQWINQRGETHREKKIPGPQRLRVVESWPDTESCQITGGKWPGRCDFCCDGRSVPPALVDLPPALAGAAQLQASGISSCSAGILLKVCIMQPLSSLKSHRPMPPPHCYLVWAPFRFLSSFPFQDSSELGQKGRYEYCSNKILL